MEKLLSRLFDYQKFRNNKKLTETINNSLADTGIPLSDDEISFVSAAGVPEFFLNEDKNDDA